ncbi:hypothetical protein HZB03_01315 [Candidatus Woesearchaeota archaeon]|nr:hypothetical protein [Candidatus Woesearchaeota archaeon]
MNRNIVLGISLILVCTLVVLSSAVAQASMLQFTDIEIKVDNEREVGIDLFGGTIDVKPESTLELKVSLENKFTSQDALTEIRSTEITATLEEIDDGDDLDWKSESFDLKAGRQKIIKQTVRVPLIVNQNRPFRLLLEAEGRDRNGTTYTDRLDYNIHIEKDAHDVRIIEAAADPAQVDCATKSNVAIVVINAGESEEKDVNIVASNMLLGTLFNETFDLSDDVRDADNEFKTHYTIPAGSLPSGKHDVFVRLNYNDNKKSDERVTSVTVTPCATTAPSSAVSKTAMETMPVTATSEQEQQPPSSQAGEKAGAAMPAEEPSAFEEPREQTFQKSQSVILEGNSYAPAILSKSTVSRTPAGRSSTARVSNLLKHDSLWMIFFIVGDVILVVSACVVFAWARRPRSR